MILRKGEEKKEKGKRRKKGYKEKAKNIKSLENDRGIA